MTGPWESFEPATLMTCEEVVAGWIGQPLNTYSNIAYFIVALILWRRSRGFTARTHEKPIAALCLFIGIASTLAHASLARVFAIMDFTAIFVLFMYVCTGNLADVYGWTRGRRHGVAVALSLLSIVPQIVNPFAGIGVFTAYLLGALGSEWLALKRLKLSKVEYRHLVTSLACLGIGLVCFLLDSRRVICTPENHSWQLHSVWHILAAFSIYFIARYFEDRHVTKA